ncbi:MAG TPA: PDZ domain-containing protein [Bacteroidota bacterium]|nr:PDZ domain-containing protein [Bacteroidota bacterium]
MKGAPFRLCALFLRLVPRMMPLFLAHSHPMTLAAQPRIQYTLSMPRPSSHVFEVSLRISGMPAGKEFLDVQLPVWRPGRYMVLDFAGGVIRFDCRSAEGSGVSWTKTDKSTWRISAAGARDLSVHYEVYADEFDQRTRGLDDQHGFIDGTSVFMYFPEYRHRPLELTVVPPAGWHVTTGLDSSAVNQFHAPDYDHLVDCPLEIGAQRDFTFDVEGVPHVLSIFGEGNWEPDTLIRDIGRIVRANREFWGSLPYRRYVFLLHCVPGGGGGTEHVNSTIMGTAPFVFRNPDTYRGFLGLVSHEYFHTWNVKQIRPAALVHPDFQKENYTEELWMAEGTTSYVDGVLLVRSGLSSREKFLEGLARMVYADRIRPGNRVQSLAQSGFDAWIKYWRGARESFNQESDYYEKGAAASLVLDLEIRHATGNARSFDDLMRTLYLRFPRTGSGYTNADVRKIAREIGGEIVMGAFDSLIYGTRPVDWERVLGYAGLDLVPSDGSPRVWTGMDLSESLGRTTVTRVVAGSPAFAAGLDIGDEVVALEGSRIASAGLSERLKDFAPGQSVRLTVFRRDRLRDFTLKLEKPGVPVYRVREIGNMTPAQKSILDSWLPPSGA